MRRYWSIIETHRQSSRETVADLTERGVQHYHPEYRGERVNGVRRTLPVFPNYVFVYVNAVEHSSLLGVEDRKRVYRPRCVEKAFIEMLRGMEDASGYLVVERLLAGYDDIEKFVAGDMVRSLRGRFFGEAVEFRGYERGGYASVALAILGGREIIAHVDAHELVGA